ncbi:Mitochondrial inner membrane protease ATP23-like protein, partial [Fragariocoptes setiger]
MKPHLLDYFPNRFPGGTGPTMRLLGGSSSNTSDRRCEEMVQHLVNNSSEVRLLIGAMRGMGCNFQLKRHISCETCGSGCNGGYDPDTNQIVICSNRSRLQGVVMSTLVHEMIHMFDYCRAKLDFSKLEHIACSEVSINYLKTNHVNSSHQVLN